MDFTLDESHEDLRKLAAEVLGRECAPDRLAARERAGAPYDRATWSALAASGLLGASLPEEVGGAGGGALGLAVLAREAGRHAAPVPLLAALAFAAPAIARHGTPDQRELLRRLATGEAVLTAALAEPGYGPVATTARPAGGGYALDGVKVAVPYAAEADLVLVPARLDGGVGVFLVDPSAAGVALAAQHTSSGEPAARMSLTGVTVGAGALLGAAATPGTPGTLATLELYALAGLTAAVSGALDAALELTTGHVKTRRQFGRALAEFQAVTMQVGDVYIAKRALDVAMWAGAWRLAHDLPDAAEVLRIAAYIACDQALVAFYTCQHLHGGIGLDVSYPLHRHFGLAKHAAALLGGAELQLERIGGLLTEPAPAAATPGGAA